MTSNDAQPWPLIFLENIGLPTPLIPLPTLGARLESTTQLAYCNHLLHDQLLCLNSKSTTVTLNPLQKAFVDAFLQDSVEQDRIQWLSIRIVQEFVMDNLKNSAAIAEVLLVAPFLNKEYYCKLLNCLIHEFSTGNSLDIELLQGLAQLIQCAGPDYLQPDDLVRIMNILRNRLQNTHQQSVEHLCYLTLALSRLLDVMVEGKVQDLNRVLDHEPMSALLGQLACNSDPYLHYQANYALQALLHIPNDETRRQYILRQAGNIAKGLLGVASVCKLDLTEVPDSFGQLKETAMSIYEVGTEALGGAQSMLDSGRGILDSLKGGLESGGRRLWYIALREAQEHVKNGRLMDFNRLVFEAPCVEEVNFQWGICQILGEIALETQWDDITRTRAVNFLAGMYKKDAIQKTENGIYGWILHIIRQIADLQDTTISQHAHSVLHNLKNEEGSIKQSCADEVLDGSINPYPLRVRLPTPYSSPLLARVQGAPNVELSLHRLKVQRLREFNRALYIPPQAKPSHKSDDCTLFPLMEMALEFLNSHRQVLLLLGDSGAGKSTFNLQLEHNLWASYKSYRPIPLYINLPTIDDPSHDLIGKQLRELNFSEEQVRELKLYREFIIICDGYDESQLKTNLYTTNEFNQPQQWKAKMVISCRSQYLGADYRYRFQPQPTNSYARPMPDLMTEAVIAPFSKSQIEQYVSQYVKRTLEHSVPQSNPPWTENDYMEKLIKIPKLMELASNPFLLTLSLEALPEVVRSKKDLSLIRISRVELYDGFVKQWLEVNKQRLYSSALDESERSAFDLILEDDFYYHGILFQKDLAEAIFREQKGQPAVSYTHLRDKTTWKSLFFSPDAHVRLLRESSTITRSGNFFRFIHRSLLEYFYSRTVYDPLNYDSDACSESYQLVADLKTALSKRSFTDEPSVLLFLAERVHINSLFQSHLFTTIEDSKADEHSNQAAANAITILVKAGISFNGKDLRNIRIPGADISSGEFDFADLEGADLGNVNLGKAWLRQANLGNATMSGVQFGELPFLRLESGVASCVFSPDDDLLAVLTMDSAISIYEVGTWIRIAYFAGRSAIAISPTTFELAKGGKKNVVELGDILSGEVRLTLTGHNDKITRIAFSSDGNKIATSSKDATIRIWSSSSGETIHILHHTHTVTDIAFSPTDHQLVSSSKDKTMRIWNVETGQSIIVLKSLPNGLHSLAWSPDGDQIAFGESKGRIAIFSIQLEKIIRSMAFHAAVINSLAYSPDGHQIISSSLDSSVHILNSQNGELLSTLSGHLESVNSAVFSSSGGYIASGSLDGSVRLWKTNGELSRALSDDDTDKWGAVALSFDGEKVVTGGRECILQLWDTLTAKPISVFAGHTRIIQEVAFSPCGQKIASASSDGTLRVWCVQTGACLHVLEGHTERVYSVAFSPNGQQIISAGEDKTVHVWDVQTGQVQLILKGHSDCVHEAVFSPDGLQIASCSADATVRLWNVQTGDQLKTMDHPDTISQVMYSPDGSELISVTTVDGILSCWDPILGIQVNRPELADQIVSRCRFSPDGRFIATGDIFEYLRLWDRTSNPWNEVYRTKIGLSVEIQWKQGSTGMYLATRTVSSLHIWKLIEENGVYSLHRLWGSGRKKLFMAEANLIGVTGLSDVDRELAEQQGAIIKPKLDSNLIENEQ